MAAKWNYVDGRLVCDAAYFGGPSCTRIYLVLDGKTYLTPAGYAPRNRLDPGTFREVPPWGGSRIPFPGYDYYVWGLTPRDYTPYIRDIGRAITPAELSRVMEENGLTDDDVSNEFADCSNCMGAPASLARQYTAIQIRVHGNAVIVASDLKRSGIEAYSGSAGRVTIRVA